MWKFVGLCLIASFVAGCGGGGGGGHGDNTASTNPTTAQPLTLSGSVVMGPVSNATVEAFCHDTTPATLIGSGRSDEQARYSFSASRACADVIELRVSGGSYVDEATGDKVEGTSVPWLRSLLDASGNDVKRTAQITPLTDLLHAQATTGSGTSKPSKATLSAARQQLIDDLKLLTGAEIDPVATEPSLVQGSTSDSGVAYTLLLAAVSKLTGPSVDGIAAALTNVRTKGFGKDSPLADPLRFVASSNDVLARIGVSQAVAGRIVIQAESYVAVEALRPFNVVPDSSGLSCEPLELQTALTKLAKVHTDATSRFIFSDLSIVLSQDSYVMALQAWKGRCPALTDSLNIFIAGESLGADSNYKEFVTRPKPLMECARAHGTVVNVIVRGTGHTICVDWDGQSAPDAFLLSSVEPAPGDPAISYERCVELSTQPLPFPWSEQYAVFMLRGTRHLYCGTKSAGSSWLDRQNIGYYPGASGGGNTTGGTSGGSSGGTTGGTSGGNGGGTADGNTIAIQIATGLQHSLALGTGGRYWAWGNNYAGKLGDGSSVDRPSPIQVALAGVDTLAAGTEASMALKSDGTVLAWGHNSYGELGDGSTTARTVPGSVSGLSGIRKLSFKYGHAMALAGDGTVWTWGSNYQGQLGDGSTLNRSIPVRVLDLAGGSPVVQIVASVKHSLALKADGTVWAWGSNFAGELGNAANADSLTAQPVVHLSNVEAIAAGHGHSMALRSDGTVWVWGDGMFGQFGTGSRHQSPFPAQVPGLSDVRAIAAGKFFSLALRGDGTVWVWGQWGETSALLTEHLTPARLGTLTGVRSMAASSDHAVMGTVDGAVWVWGSNSHGQLGLNGVSFASIPMRLSLP